MIFSKEVPTTPGFYAWRQSDSQPARVVVEVVTDVVTYFDPNRVSLESAMAWGGEWCRLVPAEEVEKAWKEGYEDSAEILYSTDTITARFNESRARRIMEGKG